MKLLLWKPYGITSNYFTQQLQHKNTYVKICYAGRLDPLAQGVMLILTDHDVKNMSENLLHNKTYTFDIILGIDTSSCDIAGTVIHDTNFDDSDINIDYINNKLIEFIASYSHQSYPPISSFVVKHDIYGRKPLWWYAKNNIDVPIPNKNVTIHNYKIYTTSKINSIEFYNNAIQRLQTITNTKTIEELEIISFIDYYTNTLHSLVESKNTKDMYKIKISMELTVSTGFYIRQFCNDFGKFINIPGIAFDITRTHVC